MKLEIFIPTHFAANSYVLKEERATLCIDPVEELVRTSLPQDNPLFFVATHGHFDHILFSQTWAAEKEANFFVHPADIPMVKDPLLNLSAYFGENISFEGKVYPLEEGPLPIPGFEAEVWHLPGHSPGSIGIFFPKEGWFFGGDVVFAFSVGRTDLPGGDEATLWKSIERILSLPDTTKIYPGHGEVFLLEDFRSYYITWRKR